MIGLLEGTVERKSANNLIIKAGGVGYLVFVSTSLLAKTNLNQNLTLEIHTHVTDDAIGLFGFLTQPELILFELLLTVSGIGPRTALNIMNQGVNRIEQAISKADVDFFTAIPRLGRKNAQKIIIELKSKLGSLSELNLDDTSSQNQELIDALVSMGFEKKEIIAALKKLPQEVETIEKQLRYMLKTLNK